MLFTYVGTVGQVAVIHENDRYYLAPNVALIRVDKTLVDPEYMRYFFQTSAFWETQINRLLQTSLDKGTQRKTTENELPSLTQCTA